jgi:Eco57I restriction-modification methylase
VNDSLISEIQSFTLSVRGILEREADEQLQGIFGWLPDGSFADAKPYPAVVHLEEARETRQRLERFAEDEKLAGFNAKAARAKLIRETAFTWLNRFVAFRLMEERKLLKQTIAKLDRSNGLIFWLTDDANKDAYALHQQGGLPLNAMGEGPSDVAYRQFLIWQCAELARDVSVLFDPATLAGRLFPRPPVLKQLIAEMTGDKLGEAWQAGNEETIGWVYQAFNAEELQAAFASAREQGKKFEPEDIPAVTQLFTIRWVVRFLVQNTLGRLWLEMHPDTRLKGSLDYLVPVEKAQPRPAKLAREINFLDPCCGSMHFGLLAFDLFVEMYREELEKGGQSGWPSTPSVASDDEIAASIIANNLHGIDIDLRAVQLSALTLFLRARTLNPQCNFTDQNLACANVEEITGGRLEEFITQARFSHPIYERILRALASRLKDSNNLGSLLRLDRDLETLIADERRKVDADKQFTLAFPGLSPEHFKTHAGIDEFFDILTDQIVRHLDYFVQASRTEGADPGHFVSETAKGLRFMRIIQQPYDVVATNPPYLSARKMNKRLAKLMADQYSETKSDLYAAFIVRCQELLKDEGLLGMLTMHSFMFISSYEDLRDRLRNRIAIQTLAHLGGGLFAVGNPGTLQTACYVLRREPDDQRREEQIGVYFRLVKEPDADSKRRAFEGGLNVFRASEPYSQVFRYAQKDFDAIPGKPWVYWITPSLRNLFVNLPSLKDVARVIHGTATYDNKRFLRYWWELGLSRICRTAENWDQFVKSKLSFVPYMKGGPPRPWYGNQEYVLRLAREGRELKEFLIEKRDKIRGEDYIFRRGLTWSDVATTGFAARLSPGGFIFDVKGSSLFPERPEEILPILNSKIAEYFLSLLNPTVSFQVGDLERLPIPRKIPEPVTALTESAIELSRKASRESELIYDFVQPLGDPKEAEARNTLISDVEKKIEDELSRLYGLTQADLMAIEREISCLSPAAIGSEQDNNQDEDETQSETTPEAWAQSWISYAVGIVLSRFEVGVPGGLGCGDFSKQAVADLKNLISTDGILVADAASERDLTTRVLKALDLMLGESKTKEIIALGCGDGNPEDELRAWLEKDFWKYHFQLYRKRPIYWPLQSPNKKFTLWIFHERFTKDTLFNIRRNIVEVRLRLLEREIADKRKEAATNKAAAKQLDKLRDLEDDLREFSKRLKEVADGGYTPHIDDGVLLNAAPLHSLLPSWPETKKAWQELENEEYEWAQQAMEYWPDRVKKKCKTNKSFAIAHGLA